MISGTTSANVTFAMNDGEAACNCNSIATACFTIHFEAVMCASAEEPPEVPEEPADAGREGWARRAAAHPPRMRESVRVVIRPEFHARSNPFRPRNG